MREQGDISPSVRGDRLQRLLARAGHGSRRSCEALIVAGRVTVDGRVATLGERADASRQRIDVDGQQLTLPRGNTTLMLNKPSGYVVSSRPEQELPSVYELLTDAPPQIRYVGRLDANSEGLLLFSTDGELVHRLTHPSYRVDKVYLAVVGGDLARSTQQALRSGVALSDRPTAPARLEVVERSERETVVRLTIHEGRNRQIRRMFSAVGHEVHRLRREAVGPVSLGRLGRGASRPLTSVELGQLRRLVGLGSGGSPLLSR